MPIHTEILHGIRAILFAVIIFVFLKGLYYLITGKLYRRNKQLLRKNQSRRIGLALSAIIPILLIVFMILGVLGFLRAGKRGDLLAWIIAEAISIIVSFVWMGIVFSRIPENKIIDVISEKDLRLGNEESNTHKVISYAGFWVRSGALLVDGLISLPLIFLYYYLFRSSWNTAVIYETGSRGDSVSGKVGIL